MLLGLRKKEQSQVDKQCQLLQSYYTVASRLRGGDFIQGGEMVWWRDDRKPSTNAFSFRDGVRSQGLKL